MWEPQGKVSTPSLTKDAEGIVGFDVWGSRVAEGAQHIEEVFKGHAVVPIVRGGEHPADPVLEGVRLPRQEQLRAGLGSAGPAPLRQTLSSGWC